MLVSLGHTGHTTDVKMQLLMGDMTLQIGQVGPDFLLLKEPFAHPPTEGTLVVQVDEREHRWPVRLPEGISAESRRVVMAKVG